MISTTMVLRMVRLASSARPSRLRDVSSSRFNSTLASAAYTAPISQDVSTSKTAEELNPIDRRRLESMLRVDHAGEVAANTIYAAQARVFSSIVGDAKTAKMCEEMWETEKKHLAVAKRLLDQHRTRPSFLMPVWSAAGSVLGTATALLGKEAAMACTEAVETVIGEHYDDQLQHLSRMEEAHPSLKLLSRVIVEFRDDELEHLDTAVEHDAQQAPAHALLSAIIGFGCKGAIQIAKRL